MPIKNHTDLNSQADAILPDNNSRDISAEDVRTAIKDINDSAVNKSGDSGIQNKLSYQTAVPISADGDIVHKKYVDDAISDVEIDESGLVHKAEDETITGIKTFEASPIVPDATDDNEAVNKLQMETAIAAAQVGLLDLRGSYDASTNLFPASGGSGEDGDILKADTWIASVAGTIEGQAVQAGDWIIALVDEPGQTSTNWAIVEKNIGYVPENSANKGQANGYASLGSDGLVPESQLPSISGGGPVKKLLGNIYSVLPESGNYVKTGSATTATYNEDGVTLTGGNNDSLNYIEFDDYVTCATNWSRRIIFTPSSAGNGIGIGLNSSNGKIIGRIILTGADNGKLVIDTYTGTTTTNRTISSTGISYSSTDTLELYFERAFMYYRLVARNLTTNTILSVSVVDPCNQSIQFSVWASSKPAIFHYGGTQNVTLDEYTVNEFTENKLLIYGNSILANMFSGPSTGSIYSQLRSVVPDGVTLIAGAGNTTNRFLTLRPEIKSLRPRIIMFCDGINDILGGIPLATTQANILTFIKDCIDIKATPVICKVLPVGDSRSSSRTDLNALNAWIATLPIAVIDTFTPFAVGETLNTAYDSGDGLHISVTGASKYFEVVTSAISNLLGITNLQNSTKLSFIDFTANKNLLASDFSLYDYKMLRGINASGLNLTIQPDTDLPVDIGSQVLVRQGGMGQITIVPGSGVTVISSFTRRKTAALYSIISLTKEAANTWSLSGDLTT